MGLRRLSTIGLVLPLFLLMGCVSSLTPAELDARLRQVSQTTAKRHALKRVVPIFVATRMEAWTLLTEARHDPKSSAHSRSLANGFKLGQHKYIDYFVGSTYSKLADQIVLNALVLNEGRRLRGLRVILVSESAPSEALRTAALSRSVKLEHYPLP